jgi:AcrR family transcriptional regulator
MCNTVVNRVEVYAVDMFRREVTERKAHGMARTGRRRGGGDTREAIRTAARRQFAEHGYEGATIRGIAADAGVDPALVMHFFGSKERLLLAGVEWPFDPDEAVPRLLAGKRSEAGERLVRLFVTTWDDEAGRNPIVALLQTALSQQSAQRLFRDFLTKRFFGPLTEGLRVDHPELRGNLAASQLVGLGIIRYVVRFEPLASLDSEDLIGLVAPTIQRYLTGRLPPPVV